MTLQDFRTVFNQKLTKLYPKTEIDAFFFRLVEHKLNLQIVDVFTKSDQLISDDDFKMMSNVLNRLQKEEPIQYILGTTSFYELNFKVNKETLIPRPETEDLVSWVIASVNKTNTKSILDIGTGSGCIAISLKKNIKNIDISAIDFSDKVLDVAKENALQNNVAINFIQTDILKTDKLTRNFDVIVSNPPYVRNIEKKEMNNNVLSNEPHSALFVSNENPLVFYDKITDLALQYLNPKGILFFEINQYLGNEMEELLTQKGFKNVELKSDLFGNPRMIKGCKL